MSQLLRRQVSLTRLRSVACGVSWALLGACSDSSGEGGRTIACGAAGGVECRDVGDVCGVSAECGSGSCEEGTCAADDDSGGSFGAGAGGTHVFVDDLEPTGGAGGAEPSCVDLDVEFARVTPTVVLLIDQSGSMLQNFDNGVNRWQTLRNTLTDPEDSLLRKLENSVRFGMSLYTSNGGFGNGDEPRQCPVLQTVDIALGNFEEMSSMLNTNGPAGDTPTAESVAVIAQRLAEFQEEGPKSIILATDGDPDTCEDPDANDDAESKAQSVAAVAAAHEAGISTHVISVGNQVTASHLEDLAVAGAGGDETAEAYTALDTTALVDAFTQIIGSVRTCDFTLEGRVDAANTSRGTVTLDGRDLAFGDEDGWEMPDETTVRLLGSACEAVQADATGISMRFPCDAIQIIPR